MSAIQITVKRVDDFKFGSLRALSSSATTRRVLYAIGNRFKAITLSNFGPSGQHRAKAWQALSDNYKKRIKYFGPPKLILGGDLQASIYVDASRDDRVEIGVDSSSPAAVYAFAHQYGRPEINLPDRPYFPVTGPYDAPELTPYAQKELELAANKEIDEIVRGR